MTSAGMLDWLRDAGLSRDASQLVELNQAIDTVEMYAAGHSESILGRALAYDDLLAACDRSLSRLQTSYIDLYLFNDPIPLYHSPRALVCSITW